MIFKRFQALQLSYNLNLQPFSSCCLKTTDFKFSLYYSGGGSPHLNWTLNCCDLPSPYSFYSFPWSNFNLVFTLLTLFI